MNFSLTEDQVAIRDLAHQIFTDRATDEFLLAFSRGERDYDEELWATLAAQGLVGLAVPESCGGSGLGFFDLCLVLEEQGRRVAPVPLFASTVLGALPVAAFGSEAQQQRWLAPLVAGEVKLSAAIAELGMPGAIAGSVRAEADGDGWRLSGHLSCVADGMVADAILVPATDSEGRLSVFVVDTTLSGVQRTAQEIGLLGDWNADLVLSQVGVGADALLGEVGQGGCIVEWIERHANVAHCALQVGVCEEAMKRTAAYIGERKQFGVALGSFQALAMRMADSYIDVEAMRSTWWLAAWRLCEGVDADKEIRAAKWWACSGGHRVVHTAQHLHGGMGADVEYPIHRFFLWAKMINYSLGGATHQLQKLGELLAGKDTAGTWMTA